MGEDFEILSSMFVKKKILIPTGLNRNTVKKAKKIAIIKITSISILQEGFINWKWATFIIKIKKETKTQRR